MSTPSTGDENIDAVVRTEFTECIAITRQILGDRLNGLVDDKVLDTLAAVIPTELWRPMANMVLIGIKRMRDLDEEEFRRAKAQGS